MAKKKIKTVFMLDLTNYPNHVDLTPTQYNFHVYYNKHLHPRTKNSITEKHGMKTIQDII